MSWLYKKYTHCFRNFINNPFQTRRCATITTIIIVVVTICCCCFCGGTREKKKENLLFSSLHMDPPTHPKRHRLTACFGSVWAGWRGVVSWPGGCTVTKFMNEILFLNQTTHPLLSVVSHTHTHVHTTSHVYINIHRSFEPSHSSEQDETRCAVLGCIEIFVIVFWCFCVVTPCCFQCILVILFLFGFHWCKIQSYRSGCKVPSGITQSC